MPQRSTSNSFVSDSPKSVSNEETLHIVLDKSTKAEDFDDLWPQPSTFNSSVLVDKSISSENILHIVSDNSTKTEEFDDIRPQTSTSTSGVIVGRSDKSISSEEIIVENGFPLVGLNNEPEVLAKVEKYKSLFFQEKVKTKKYKRILGNAHNKIKSLEKQIRTSSKSKIVEILLDHLTKCPKSSESL